MELKCAICSKKIQDKFFANYPNVVCRDCDQSALSEDGEPPKHDSMGDSGDNPVYIQALNAESLKIDR